MFVASLVFLLVVCALLSYGFHNVDKTKSSGQNTSDRYLAFRNNYIFVYLLMMSADWLQGPYVYPLYKHYNYDLEAIGILFIVGFLSSAVFGTAISSLADQYGRKKFCLAFSVIYIGSCFTKLSPNYAVLLFGRLLGGISTSLLFSVFESWMVSEHFSRGFPPELLSATFSWATYGNAVVAILSGLLANFAVDFTGSLVSPFMMSALLLAIGGLVVMNTWGENYGEIKSSQQAQSSLMKGFKAMRNDLSISAVGIVVALFESTMYIFVFLWGPVLESNDKNIPYGLIFAAFMVCIMIGSIVFRVALAHQWTPEKLAQPLLAAAAFSLLLPIFTSSQFVYFWAFNFFELCCGIYFPMIGTIRSKYVPEETRTSVMNIFRVPLNLIVVLVLHNVSSWSHQFIFTLCVIFLTGSLLASTIVTNRASKEYSNVKTVYSSEPNTEQVDGEEQV